MLTVPNEVGGVSVEHEVSGEIGEGVKLLSTLVPETHIPNQLGTVSSWLHPHLTRR